MNVSTPDGINFRLEAVNSDDDRLIDQMDHARAAYVVATERTKMSGGEYAATAIHLTVDTQSEPALVAQSGRQALSALGQLFGLGFTQAAKDGHISPTATNPQTQEQLAACLVQIQVVLESLRDVVLKQEVMVKKVCCAHCSPVAVETCIVKD